MYSQQELDDAVASGVITQEAANALRLHISQQRATAIPDEEQFRLLTGFNDIFVSIAAAILLFAVGWIGQSIGQSTGLAIDVRGPTFVGPLFVAATAWGLMSARHNVRQRPWPIRENPMKPGPAHHSKARGCTGMPRLCRNGMNSWPKVDPPPSRCRAKVI